MILPVVVVGRLLTAVAVVVKAIHTRFGPPPLQTLNPLFLILTRGGRSLLRVTSLTSGNFVGANLGVVVFTLISVAMGLTAGMAIADRFGLRAG
jgi:fructose-specific phosphotransferase system IIC component